MKKLNLILILLAFAVQAAFLSPEATAQAKAAKTEVSQKIEVYYFHYSRRCASCIAVEEEAERSLKALYPKAVEQGMVTFISVNIEEANNAPLMKSLGVQGQTLLVVSGDNQENITNAGFLHARSNTDKFRKTLKESVAKVQS
jgi:hypothetical protein